MSEQKAYSPKVHPGLTFVFLLGLCYWAQWLYPLSFPEKVQDHRFWFAGACLSIGTIIGGLAFMAMKKCGTPVEPGSEADKLVTCGLFRFSRNPLYIALLFWSLAFAGFSGSFWFIFGTLYLFFVLNFMVIPQEEKYLLKRFGAEDEEYRKKVRRWV